MPVATFDTLKFSKALREAGVSEKQADAEATVLAEVFSVNFREIASKDDVKQSSESVEVKLRELEHRLNAKIDQLSLKQSSDMTMIKWMFGVLIPIGIAIGVRLLLMPLK